LFVHIAIPFSTPFLLLKLPAWISDNCVMVKPSNFIWQIIKVQGEPGALYSGAVRRSCRTADSKNTKAAMDTASSLTQRLCGGKLRKMRVISSSNKRAVQISSAQTPAVSPPLGVGNQICSLPVGPALANDVCKTAYEQNIYQASSPIK